MTPQVETGLIQADDIEELSLIVDPWELRMNQISSGKFRAMLAFVQIKGVFLTREVWSNRVVATGSTPPGFLHLAGVCTVNTMTYAGVEIDSGKIMCGLDAKTTDFMTPDGADHWVMLVPIDQITDVLGEELAAELLPKGHTLSYDPVFIRKLASLVTETVAALSGNSWCHAEEELLNTIHSRLIAAVCRLLTHAKRDDERGARQNRHLVSRLAISLAENFDEHVSVSQLAESLGVGRRTLELGFRRTFNLSPQFYLRRARLNGLHRALRDTGQGQTTVTEAAMELGFTELGRTAVEYRKLFGESPSTTLKRGKLEEFQSYSAAI